jgi:hypothetical protein
LGWLFYEKTYPILDLRRASPCSSRSQCAPVEFQHSRMEALRNLPFCWDAYALWLKYPDDESARAPQIWF